MNPHHGAENADLDLREKGMSREGQPERADTRLYMQLLAFGGCRDQEAVRSALERSGFEAVLYTDILDPRGIAVLLMNEDPAFFTKESRALLNLEPFASLAPKPALTMFGRTYALGRETGLVDWLLHKPRRAVLNPAWPWAVWYPLRRKPEFELLPREEQGKILYEHAKIGMTYGRADLAHDVRLASYGLDTNDNEFVIGLVGKDLHPLSRVVEEMRKTQQTALYIQTLGPFFIGRAAWQSPLSEAAKNNAPGR